jgi:hypothetical protein
MGVDDVRVKGIVVGLAGEMQVGDTRLDGYGHGWALQSVAVFTQAGEPAARPTPFLHIYASIGHDDRSSCSIRAGDRVSSAFVE